MTAATRLAAQPSVRRRRWRVIETRQTGDCRNRHDRCRRRPPCLPTTGSRIEGVELAHAHALVRMFTGNPERARDPT